jgi:hypothetical protein
MSHGLLYCQPTRTGQDEHVSRCKIWLQLGAMSCADELCTRVNRLGQCLELSARRAIADNDQSWL